jgi:type IX secretion system PorP/SprF family membrane protein
MKKLILIAMFLWVTVTEAQHYPAFSQYVVNGMVINPAYAGRHGAMDVTLGHRRQWVGFNGAPNTTTFGLNTPLKVKSISVGFSFINDKIGSTNNQLFNVMYAYRIRIKRKYKLSFGLQNGVIIKKTNWDMLSRNDQQDALLNGKNMTSVGFLSGFGIYFYGKNLFVGASAPYLVNTLNKNFLSENPILVSAGYYFALDDDNGLKPSFLVKYIKGSPIQGDINLNYYYKQRFGLGVSYRTKESIVGILEFGVNEQLKFSYSYDCGLNRLKHYNSGSHELLIRYYFGYSANARNPRAFSL